MQTDARAAGSLTLRVGMLAGALLALAGALSTASAAEGGSVGPVGPSPVEVENQQSESDLTRVRLVPRAAERLGIRTVIAERVPVARTRSVGGIAITPPGRAIQVAAPSEGIVLAVDGTAFPFPGTRVRAGSELLRLLVVSGPELARARDVIEVARARVAVAEEAAASGGGAAAEAELAAARASLAAAETRQRTLTGSGSGAEQLAPVVVAAPISGVVRSLAVSPGQAVPPGAPLLEIVLTDPIWVRVPVFAGELASLATDREAAVLRLGEEEARVARSVAGPPSADPNAAAIDLYYSVANPSGELRDGERVEVRLPMRSAQQALPIPYAAVLYDIHGATWVYEQVEEHVYVRRRVEIAYVENGRAVATQGPADGARIVVEGAAELFGAEFGIGR